MSKQVMIQKACLNWDNKFGTDRKANMPTFASICNFSLASDITPKKFLTFPNTAQLSKQNEQHFPR